MSISNNSIYLNRFESLSIDVFEEIIERESDDWEEILKWDYKPIADTFRYMLKNRILPGIALIKGNTCMGYIYYVIKGYRVIFGGFYYLEDFASTNWPRLMMEKLFNDIRLVPYPEAIEGQIIFPGPEKSLGAFFSERGFSFVRRSFMRLDKIQYKETKKTLRDLELLPADYSFIDDMALLLQRCYSNHVDQNVSSLYTSFQGCSHLLTQIMLRGGCGMFDRSLSYLAFIRNELKGGIMTSRIYSNSFFISQIFVSPEFQGKEIGTYLIQTVINELAKKRIGLHLSLTVTKKNERAYKWYRRLGFKEIVPHFSFLKMST